MPDKDYREFISLYTSLRSQIREEDIPKDSEQKNRIINASATESYRRDQKNLYDVIESYFNIGVKKT